MKPFKAIKIGEENQVIAVEGDTSIIIRTDIKDESLAERLALQLN
jgi:hypothetical protein